MSSSTAGNVPSDIKIEVEAAPIEDEAFPSPTSWVLGGVAVVASVSALLLVTVVLGAASGDQNKDKPPYTMGELAVLKPQMDAIIDQHMVDSTGNLLQGGKTVLPIERIKANRNLRCENDSQQFRKCRSPETYSPHPMQVLDCSGIATVTATS